MRAEGYSCCQNSKYVERLSTRIKTKEIQKFLLSYALLQKAQFYIDNPSHLSGLPEAVSGKTTVYLPKDLPIVLKKSGIPSNKERFHQMQQVREICEKSRYDLLVIPKARLYDSFIIESRLPITLHGTKEQMGLYKENLDKENLELCR